MPAGFEGVSVFVIDGRWQLVGVRVGVVKEISDERSLAVPHNGGSPVAWDCGQVRDVGSWLEVGYLGR